MISTDVSYITKVVAVQCNDQLTPITTKLNLSLLFKVRLAKKQEATRAAVIATGMRDAATDVVIGFVSSQLSEMLADIASTEEAGTGDGTHRGQHNGDE